MRDAWNDDDGGAVSGFDDYTMDDVPDGHYDATIVDFSVFMGKGGLWFASWWFRILSGLNAGKLLQRFNGLEHGFSFVKKDLRIAFGRVPAWDELVWDDRKDDDCTFRIREDLRAEIVGATAKVKQRTRKKGGKTYVDVFLNKIVAPPSDNVQKAPEPSQEEPDDLQVAEDKWEKERVAEEADSGSLPAPDEEGWGDPDCATCKGEGCDSCAPF